MGLEEKDPDFITPYLENLPFKADLKGTFSKESYL